MKKLGLIGFPLEHSFSKKFFTEKFKNEGVVDWVYDLYPMKDIEELPELLDSNPQLCGLNVTIPYKQAVLPYLDELDKEAVKVGAVNTITINRTGNKFQLKGYNTDVYGFEKSLVPLLNLGVKKALVLGTGGASRAVAYVMNELSIEFEFVSRKSKNSLRYSELTEDIMNDHKLIVNTTPLGMFPEVNGCPPIPYHFLTPAHICYDLIYNPSETLFLKKANEQGAAIKNGLEMLQLQAEESWRIFTNT